MSGDASRPPVEPDVLASGTSSPPPPLLLSWPPPGLERTQGAFRDVAGMAALGGLILAVPVLVAVGRDYRFWSLGPFGGPGGSSPSRAWWGS